LLRIAIRSEKSPLASFFAVTLICMSGTHIDFTKYIPLNTTTRITPALISSAVSIIPESWLSMSFIEDTYRSAL